jgi:hypothetical protein
MAKDSRFPLAFACAIAICSIFVADPGFAAVGRTAGRFNVGNTGSATYTIPIFTPPGPRGMQPSVALVYSSSGGSSTLGRGWSLAGFSSIVRCGKTIAQDGETSAPSLGKNDGYCLDGNRLRRTGGGTYGEGGSVYMTELSDFSRITANVTTDYGPESWTVERKDGSIYTYGGTTDSRALGYGAITQWMLSEIRDRAGNKVRFKLADADTYTVGTTHPEKVEWTQTSSGSGTYVNSMEFDYDANGNVPASTPTGAIGRGADVGLRPAVQHHGKGLGGGQAQVFPDLWDLTNHIGEAP